MNIWYILLTILTLSALILVHELGHFITARRFGVAIREFSIGMGPKLLSKMSKKSGISYSIRLLPIGGFVSMVGEDEESSDENALNRKPVWQRMLITVAGAAMNIGIGVILMSAVVLTSPNIGGTVVAKFVDNAASSHIAGLEIGDKITAVNGTPVHIASELAYEIMRNGIEPVDLTVKRSETTIILPNVTFPTIEQDGTNYGMVDFIVAAEPKNALNICEQIFFRSISTVKMIWESLIDLISGRYGLSSVSGPVGVTTAVSEAASSGLNDYLYLVTVITINLGIFNLLPLPALDGGRFVFQFVELVRRKPVKPQLEGIIHLIGITLLMALMILITFEDITKLL